MLTTTRCPNTLRAPYFFFYESLTHNHRFRLFHVRWCRNRDLVSPGRRIGQQHCGGYVADGSPSTGSPDHHRRRTEQNGAERSWCSNYRHAARSFQRTKTRQYPNHQARKHHVRPRSPHSSTGTDCPEDGGEAQHSNCARTRRGKDLAPAQTSTLK